VQFQILSHAGLRVAAGGKELICDPWLVGSVYWRSWWNYPPVPKALVESLKPDFIYLTHLHWDHFQSASLRRFPDDVQILVPYDRYGRMTRDLAAIGKTNVRELRHGERIELAPGLAIRSFHFSPFVTDSAVVIEAEGTTLFNANDAKFMGGPLKQILRAYPKIDFAFRSHSSANPRACFHYLDAPDEVTDDNAQYLRSFAQFMEVVKPRYAIPFASNNCLLHDDVFEMNALTQTPLAVCDYFTDYAAAHGLDTKIQVMTPGDAWSSEHGFAIADHDYFTARDRHLADYRARVQPTMEKQRRREARAGVSLKGMQRFFGQLSREVPGPLKRSLRSRAVLIVSRSEKRTDFFAVDLAAGQVRTVAPAQAGDFDMRIEFPALILMQAITMNMFSHAGISKRVHYYATQAAMPALRRFVALCDLKEAEIFPLSGLLSRRAVRAGLPRWREGLLYFQMALDMLRGANLVDLETKYLRRGA
jgi:UDP-MurNAc hydroxylase